MFCLSSICDTNRSSRCHSESKILGRPRHHQSCSHNVRLTGTVCNKSFIVVHRLSFFDQIFPSTSQVQQCKDIYAGNKLQDVVWSVRLHGEEMLNARMHGLSHASSDKSFGDSLCQVCLQNSTACLSSIDSNSRHKTIAKDLFRKKYW